MPHEVSDSMLEYYRKRSMDNKTIEVNVQSILSQQQAEIDSLRQQVSTLQSTYQELIRLVRALAGKAPANRTAALWEFLDKPVQF